MSKIHKLVSPSTGKISWKIYWYDPEGKQKSKTFGNKKVAEAYQAKVQVSKKEMRYHDVFDVKKETRLTFNALADKYVEEFKTQKSFFSSKVHVIQNLRERFGDMKLSQIGRYELVSYRNYIKATPTPAGTPMGGRQRSDATVNGYLITLQHMLSMAVEWGDLEVSPFKKGKRLAFKLDNRRLRFLTEPEIAALLGECPPHLKPIVKVALNSGMRRGELLGLKWEQIRNGFIYLEGAMCKSGKGRQIPINSLLDEVFREMRLTNQLISPYVFCDSNGRRYNEVTRSFNGACRRAGIENFHFHDLRHTFAARLVMNKVSLKAIQELLGHADMSMTMRYAHLSQDHLRDAVGVLDNLPGITETLRTPTEGKKASVNLL